MGIIKVHCFRYKSEAGEKIYIRIGEYEKWLFDLIKLNKKVTLQLTEVIDNFCRHFQKTEKEGRSIIIQNLHAIHTKTGIAQISEGVIKCNWELILSTV